jgi:hypothetical protein
MQQALVDYHVSMHSNYAHNIENGIGNVTLLEIWKEFFVYEKQTDHYNLHPGHCMLQL